MPFIKNDLLEMVHSLTELAGGCPFGIVGNDKAGDSCSHFGLGSWTHNGAFIRTSGRIPVLATIVRTQATVIVASSSNVHEATRTEVFQGLVLKSTVVRNNASGFST